MAVAAEASAAEGVAATAAVSVHPKLRVSLSLRFKDLLGPVTRVRKKKKKTLNQFR